MGNSGSISDEEALRNTATGDEGQDDLLRADRRQSSDWHSDIEESESAIEARGLYSVEDATDEDQHAASNICYRSLKRLRRVIFSENWLFLIVLGIVTALVGFGIDASIYYLYVAQVTLANLAKAWAVQYIIWIAWCLAFSALAILPIILISPYASGSGIPEMKCILSGIELNRFLNFRTLVSKCVGLIMAYASGLSIGKEGPFVHIASILCSLLTKLPFFKYIRVNNAAYMQVLSAATAAGVTSAFGTPVGGVFFSMEVTSTFYHVENLWRAFFVSITAKLISVILRQFAPFGLDLFDTKYTGLIPWRLIELLPFAFMGISFGLLSGAFVRLLTLVFRLSRIRAVFQTSYGQLIRAAMVCLLIALVAFPLPLLRNDQNFLMTYLGAGLSDRRYWPLALQCVAKFTLTLFSVAFTGAAAGVFGPVFVEGALLGRLFGEVVALLFPSLNASPTAYAIVGAAAFASGVTRTISTAIIVVELTMQVQLLLPVLLAVLLANFFGRMISPSVYSVLIQAKDLPQLPRFKLFSQSTSKTAGEIMRTDVQYLHSTATVGEVADLVKKSDFPSFPLVDSDGFFCGVVRRAKLASYLKRSGIKTHTSSIGDIGQRVLNRAVKQWDERNHAFDSAQNSHSHIPAHLEPEDLEPALSSTPSGTSSLLGPDGVIMAENQASFGRKADLAKLSAALLAADSSAMDPSSSASPSSVRSSSEHLDAPVPLDRALSSDPDSVLTAPIPLIFNTTNVNDTSVIDVDTTVFTITPDATVTKVHFMFTVLGISHIFIVRRGKLLGLITRKDLIKAINSMNYEKK